MSEIRKPKYVLMLRKQGKNRKIELFEAKLWKNAVEAELCWRFRVRVDGKWWPRGKMRFFTKTQVKELIFKNIEA